MHSLLKINGKYSFAFVVWPSAAQRLLSPCLYANKRMRRFMQKFYFFSPSTTGLPNLARDVYVSFYLFRLSPMAVGIGLGWAPPIGLPPPISRGGCRKSLADYVSNSLALFLPESLRVNTHLGTSSICQSISETIRCGQSISPPWHSNCNGLRFVTHSLDSRRVEL